MSNPSPALHSQPESVAASPHPHPHPHAHPLTRRDFQTDLEVRWCPGCGDYSILNQVQKVLASLGMPRENFVFVSGIGCSSRFPYYVNTYGFHGIHGRAPAIATGVKCANPKLSVWVITGDGDGLSIGTNHLIHCLRRNVDLKILLFNNRIYGLTKGQYSPTSEFGKRTKSSPAGTIEEPISPVRLALAAQASFVARSLASDPHHLARVLDAAARHHGTAFVEILQDCRVFNEGAFDHVARRSSDADANTRLLLESGKPLRFGAGGRKGIGVRHMEPFVVDVTAAGNPETEILVHNAQAPSTAFADLLAGLMPPDFPLALGVFRQVARPVYEDLMMQQVADAVAQHGPGKLRDLLSSGTSWEVK
jgi:2-oxoglutarate/2-oxoacid ferredoxin oxidoreductase subunit beta